MSAAVFIHMCVHWCVWGFVCAVALNLHQVCSVWCWTTQHRSLCVEECICIMHQFRHKVCICLVFLHLLLSRSMASSWRCFVKDGKKGSRSWADLDEVLLYIYIYIYIFIYLYIYIYIIYMCVFYIFWYNRKHKKCTVELLKLSINRTLNQAGLNIKI